MGASITNDMTAYAVRAESGSGLFTVALIIGLYLLILAIGIANYVLSSIGLYRIAKRRCIANPFLAWIPVANVWIMGEIAQEYDNRNGIKRNWKIAMIVPYLLEMLSAIVLTVLAVVMAILVKMVTASAILAPIIVFYIVYLVTIMSALVFAAVNYICNFKIFESTVPEKALKYLILSITIPLASGICLYKCRNSGYSCETDIAEDTPQYIPPVEEH